MAGYVKDVGFLVYDLLKVLHRTENLLELNAFVRRIDCFLDALSLTIEVKKLHAMICFSLHIHGGSMYEGNIDSAFIIVTVLLELKLKDFFSLLQLSVHSILTFYIILEHLNLLVQLDDARPCV